MARGKPEKPFTSETGRLAGMKSKRKPLDHAWREKLEALKDGDKSRLDELFNILIEQAADGNIRAVTELLDRSYGKAKQVIDNNISIASPEVAEELEELFSEPVQEKKITTKKAAPKRAAKK